MSRNFDHQTYYDILEVAPTAPQNEIHRAYQRAKATYSPDSAALYSVFTREEAKELLILVEEAFSVLSNQATRFAYDERLRRQGSPGAPIPAIPTAAAAPADFLRMPMPQTSPSNIIGTEGVGSIRTMGRPQEELPEGQARTRISTYSVDPTMEAEIQSATEFSGEFLGRVREYRNISIEILSRETRIGKSHLVAIEKEDVGSLPAPVYTRGFVVQMARALGLPADKVAASYLERLGRLKSK